MHCMRERSRGAFCPQRCCRPLSMKIGRPAEALMESFLGIWLKVYACKVTLDMIKEFGR